MSIEQRLTRRESDSSGTAPRLAGKTALITVGIFNFLGQWNQYLLPLVLNPDRNRYVLPQGLAFLSIQQGYQNDWSALFAALTITMIPTIAVYALFQRRLEQGLTAGALKG